MEAHVSAETPNEACGLIAGHNGEAQHIFLIENELKSPMRYRMAPKQQLDAFMDMEMEGWELLAIYHSHPNGPSGPSQTDLAEAFYSEALQVIWSRTGERWLCRAFLFENKEAAEVEIRIGEDE